MNVKNIIFLICGLAFTASNANATIISETLGEFNGGTFGTGAPYPLPPVTVGVFSSIPIGESLISGTISGTFGNSTVSSSAGVDLYLGDGSITNDILVASCVRLTPCYFSGIDPWSYTFDATDILALSAFSGPLTLSAVQTSEFVIRLGETTLEGVSGPIGVPEPNIIALMGLGLIGIGLIRRKRLNSN